MSIQTVVRIIDRTEKTVLVWTILGLAGIGFVQVFTRYLFNYSFTWFEEFGRYIGVFIAFLGASIGVKTGSHFTMDLIVTSLARPWRQVLRFATNTLSSVFFGLVVWFSIQVVRRLYGYETTSPTMGIPMYLVYLPIPFFSLVMAFRFFCLGMKELADILAPKSSAGNEVHS
ncbi:TRAP transporter small permease [Desulfogranum japonicum]|uniref:TRAP transporter small permease n=1 Tax=Desulfogranum japonicum TaxID=231447 RepID=UPI0004017B64|nr:TRAP transporter small permease [Desulfogranum japonicum]